MLLAWLAALMGFLQSSVGRMAGWLRYQSILRLKLFLHPTTRRNPALDDLRDEDILYRSEHFIVANKACNVVVNSEEAKYPVSLATQLAHKFPQDVDPNTKFQFR
jgi:23S rRNA-/tRNA-specific pseudouridylate synthase